MNTYYTMNYDSNFTASVFKLKLHGLIQQVRLNRYTHLIKFIFIHFYLIEFIYIHDYMGPGYDGAACCTILRSGGP